RLDRHSAGRGSPVRTGEGGMTVNLEEILTALREKRVTPEEARALLRARGASVPATQGVPAPGRPAARPAPAAPAEAAGRDGRDDDGGPIAIVGMSGRYATAADLEEYWSLLAEGRSGVREIPSSRWDMDRYYDPAVGKEG